MTTHHFLPLIAALGVFVTSGLHAQQKVVAVDLYKLAPRPGQTVLKRTASALDDGARKGVRLSESTDTLPTEGVVYLDSVEFGSGTIEVDLRGKDVQGRSFIGVAFHVVDSATYEAVYFRPFNFRIEDSTRHAHAVQYISHPTYPWQKLRTEHPGQYEKPVSPVPDPNGWFHARIVVSGSTVSAYVGDATQPSLVVTRLSDRATGRVGLWVGGNSGGDFANLTIRPNTAAAARRPK